MSSTILYPTSPREALLREYVGKSIGDVPTPAAVVNVAAVRRNCSRMLQTVEALGLGWRAHIKTHKTMEATRLQVGDDVSRPANLVVSTLAEAEFIQPLLEEWRGRGRSVNILYGLPMTRNAVSRLAQVARSLGDGSVSVLLDDPAQLAVAEELGRVSGVPPRALIKIDMGGRRAGVEPDSARFVEVVDGALAAHGAGTLVLAGLYSHAGHSYGGDSRGAAMRMMGSELGALLDGADRIKDRAGGVGLPALTLSGGASPTTLSVQNLVAKDQGAGQDEGDQLRSEMEALSGLLATIKAHGHEVEIHAGVYPMLDLQQLAAHSLAASRLSWRDMALTVVAEVHGVYPGRGEGGTAEALVGAGGLALGREPCKAYDGMAVVSPWGRRGVEWPECDVERFEGWTVGRFSQEHGILTWARGKKGGEAGGEEGKRAAIDAVEAGQRVRLWPNHACITSSHFGWYFVVDEDRGGRDDEIVDVWIKARGW